MQIEILTEDSSTHRLLQYLLPQLLGPGGGPHTRRCHAYRGIGHLPPRLAGVSDPSRRILLERLPGILRAHARTQGIDSVVIILDADDRDCTAFLAELKAVADACHASHLAMFRLAIEETEAWYLGDREALEKAYPKAKRRVLNGYVQDSVCGTWELLADALYPGGRQALRKPGAPRPGDLKHEWANRIGPFLDPDRNLSPSFGKLRDGLRRLVGLLPPSHTAPPLPC